MAAALVLVFRYGSETEARWAQLAGETSRGDSVRLTLVDDHLTQIDVRPAGRCRPQSRWASWRWQRSDGLGRIVFQHEGSGFRVRERAREPDVRWVADLRGELNDDGDSARGTIYTRWVNDQSVCEGRVRFSVTKKP